MKFYIKLASFYNNLEKFQNTNDKKDCFSLCSFVCLCKNNTFCVILLEAKGSGSLYLKLTN